MPAVVGSLTDTGRGPSGTGRRGASTQQARRRGLRLPARHRPWIVRKHPWLLRNAAAAHVPTICPAEIRRHICHDGESCADPPPSSVRCAATVSSSEPTVPIQARCPRVKLVGRVSSNSSTCNLPVAFSTSAGRVHYLDFLLGSPSTYREKRRTPACWQSKRSGQSPSFQVHTWPPKSWVPNSTRSTCRPGSAPTGF